MKQFDLKEDEILVVNQEGQFYCLEARCSHAGAPLYEGSLKDDGPYLSLALFSVRNQGRIGIERTRKETFAGFQDRN